MLTQNLSDEIIWTYNLYISHVHDIYWITILNSVYEFVHAILSLEPYEYLNKGNNKITELRTILQRESPNS
jgi:hypothetical protein